MTSGLVTLQEVLTLTMRVSTKSKSNVAAKISKQESLIRPIENIPIKWKNVNVSIKYNEQSDFTGIAV